VSYKSHRRLIRNLPKQDFKSKNVKKRLNAKLLLPVVKADRDKRLALFNKLYKGESLRQTGKTRIRDTVFSIYYYSPYSDKPKWTKSFKYTS